MSVADRMKIAPNPSWRTSAASSISLLPTSTATSASTPSAAHETGRLSQVPPSTQVRRDRARGEEARQRTARVDGVAQRGIGEAGAPPGHLHAALQIDGVHQHGRRELVEAAGRHDARDERLQRFRGVEARRPEPGAGDRGRVDAEELLAREREGALAHDGERRPGAVRGRDQRADARPGEQRRPDAALLEHAEHAEMCEPLEPTAPEHETDAGRRRNGDHAVDPHGALGDAAR